MGYKNTSNPALDAELMFLTNVLKLTALHYGCWNEDDELTIDNLKAAQQRYSDTLVTMVPEGVETILDVGCGLCDISAALAHRGHQVTALSPDQNHREYFEKHRNGDMSFQHVKFENFNTSQKFDLVLMSESQNYFDMDMGLRQTINHLNKGGYLLVSGTFKKEPTTYFRRVHSIESAYLERANHFGFELIQTDDITKQVFPHTLWEHKVYEEHLVPVIDIIKKVAGKSLPLKIKILKFFSRKTLKFLAEVYDDRKQRADPALVEEHLKYMRFLFVYR